MCSFLNPNPREPLIFRIFRGIFIMILSAVFIPYVIWIFYKQHNDVDESDLTISIDKTNQNIYPDFSICHIDPNNSPNFLNNLYGNLGNLNITNITNLTCNKSGESCNNYINQDHDNCWTFSPFEFSKREEVYNKTNNCAGICDNKIKNSRWIVFNITSNILPPAGSFSDYFVVRFNYIFTNDLMPQEVKKSKNMHLFNKGKLVVFDFRIRISKKYRAPITKVYGLDPETIEANIDVVINELQQAENSSYTILILKPSDSIYTEEETYQYTMGFIVSSLGGFYGAIYGIYVLCFGPQKHSPWGLTQKYMCCWNIRREYERKLAKRYVSKAGIPLVSPLPSSDNEIIKDRIERLEAMLEECYLDADYFETLRCVLEKNKEYEEKYEPYKK